MPSFSWRDVLTVSVTEMSRAQALDCTRHFNLMVGVMSTIDDLLREADILAALYAPAVVRYHGDILAAGEKTIDLGDGETLTLTLPITREAFMALPMSLTERWISVAITANDWLIESLKKSFEGMLATTSAPVSGSAPSSEPTAVSPTTTTTGG